MKKSISLFLMILTLCLVLLPTAAFAAGDSYGPDEEGWGYTASEKVIDLGEIEYDGTEKVKCGSFTVTIKNTGTRTLSCESSEASGNMGETLRYYTPAISIQPGEEAEVTIQYTVPQGMKCKSYENYHYIYFDGAPGNIQFLPKFTLVEPEISSNDQSQTTPSSKGESTPVNISASQAESQLKLSFGSRHIDLGTIYQMKMPGADARTVTITNNSSVEVAAGFQGGTGVLSGNVASKVLLIKPGESRDYTFKIDGQSPKKGSDTLDLLVIVEPKEEGRWVTPVYYESWTSGDRYLIEEAYTVSYDLRSLADAEEGDIDWTISASSIDFGVSDVPFEGASFHKAEKETITITNQGSLPFRLEAEVDTSACERKDKDRIFKTTVGSDYRVVKAGESTEVIVWADSGSWSPGVVEGVLKFTAYYPDSKEQNTVTAHIPLSIKYLEDGGYRIANRSDNSYGTVKTSDGVARDPYSGNNRFVAKEGSSVTFVMTPYDPAAYHVSDIKLNGESVGTGSLVNNTYTISDIRDNYEFEAVFAPGADPNAQQSQPTEQPTGGTAYASTQNVLVDGKAVEFQCYALKDEKGNDTNYVKLRDVAQTLNGTAVQFQVGWDGAVNIETGKGYTSNGSEMHTPFAGNRDYSPATAPTNVNGQTAALEAIVLLDDNGGAYTYYKLRDLGAALNFKVDWSAEKGIFIETE